jgi:hypothetical protein
LTIDIGHLPESLSRRSAAGFPHAALVKRVHNSVAISLWLIAATAFIALSRIVGVAGIVITRDVGYSSPSTVVFDLEIGLFAVAAVCFFGTLLHIPSLISVGKNYPDRLNMLKRPWPLIVLALSILPVVLYGFAFPGRENWPVWLSSEIRGLIHAICILFPVVGHLCLILVQLMRLNKVLLEDLEARKI